MNLKVSSLDCKDIELFDSIINIGKNLYANYTFLTYKEKEGSIAASLFFCYRIVNLLIRNFFAILDVDTLLCLADTLAGDVVDSTAVSVTVTVNVCDSIGIASL